MNVVSILQNKYELLWKVNEMDNCRSSDAGILQKNCGKSEIQEEIGQFVSARCGNYPTRFRKASREGSIG